MINQPNRQFRVEAKQIILDYFQNDTPTPAEQHQLQKLASKIRQERNCLELTRQQCADHIGASYTQLVALENAAIPFPNLDPKWLTCLAQLTGDEWFAQLLSQQDSLAPSI